MPDELVVDASVAAKAFFFEEGSELARELLTSNCFISAPDLLFVEMASIAVKRARRGLSPPDQARAAVEELAGFVNLVAPTRGLSVQAFLLASEHGFSAYDAVYLALAERRGAPVVTADMRLIGRAKSAGLADLVRALVD